MKPTVGAAFPDVELPDADGELVRLSDLRGAPVVLYFYPADDTPGCTREACSFRDAYEDFQDAGAVVLGVSNDDPETHKRFAQRHRLPFKLLCDADGAVAKRLGVRKTLGIVPGRVTFVLDADGVLLHRFESQFMADRHVKESLAILRHQGQA